MTTLDSGLATLRSAANRIGYLWDRLGLSIKRFMPTGLYARALLIIIAPMVILQSVVAFVFMERHWNSVTQKLSASVVADIAALIEIHHSYPQDAEFTHIKRIAQEKLGLVVDFLPVGEMPQPGPKPFFSLLDQALSVELRKQIKRPFWIDTVGRSALVEIRIKLDNAVMRVIAPRSAAYASNSGIFLMWMVGTSLVLLTVAILFLRNQIRPILRLADAAEAFGKGRDMPNFRPRGAREVRRAAVAFIEMKLRVERAIEQRTAMLAGVSHDLRTILTRFKLELALLGDTPEIEAMKKDVDEMGRMLEAYLAFARGDMGEAAVPTDMAAILDELKADAERSGHKVTSEFHGQPIVTVKSAAFKRCLANLVSNAARHANSIAITGHRDHRWLNISVDDDGPGIPAAMREEVFKPFLRLDNARNQDEGGSGLGLAIARDIARSHGGDIMLGDSPLGGLRATVARAQAAGAAAQRLGNDADVVDKSCPSLAARQFAIKRRHRPGKAGIFVVEPDPEHAAIEQGQSLRADHSLWAGSADIRRRQHEFH
jgi:two-component system osmolarity sensor histidine kinase EnvZ